MSSTIMDRPHLQAWRRRRGAQLAQSGRLSQVAHILAAEDGCSANDWISSLRAIMTGASEPTIDIVTRIDRVLARPAKAKQADSEQMALF